MHGTNVACVYYVVNRLSTGRDVCSNTVSIVIPAIIYTYNNITLYNRIALDPLIVIAYTIFTIQYFSYYYNTSCAVHTELRLFME